MAPKPPFEEENIDDWARRVVRESRAAQGLPPYIEDPAFLAEIVALLRAPASRHETVRVEPVGAAYSGLDRDSLREHALEDFESAG